MKKKLIFLSIAASFVLLATSCKKDDPAPAPTTIHAYWKGKSGEANVPPTDFFGILFKPGGLVRVYTGNEDTTLANKKDGTYTLQNGIVQGKYDNDQVSFKGSVDANLSKITNGTWGFTPSNDNGGTFFLDRQP